MSQRKPGPLETLEWAVRSAVFMERFADPGSRGRVLYRVTSREGAALAMADLLLRRIEGAGIEITDEILDLVLHKVRVRSAQWADEARKRGVPACIRTLFEAQKKGDAIRLAKGMTITSSDFSDLIENCTAEGWIHTVQKFEAVPEHLRIDPGEAESLSVHGPGRLAGTAAKAFRKIKATFEHRTRRVAHLFERGDAWHCLYFTYRDLEAGESNHWSGGAHVHYLSCLWVKMTKDELRRTLSERRIPVSGVHIAFSD